MILVKNLKLFPVFILVKKGQENLLDDILEKKASRNYENRKLKIEVKKQDFSRGVSPWFWSKI